MFTPQAVWAQDFLKGKKDPPEAVRWWPATSFVSCDGHTAVNTGPWSRERGTRHGYFTTVWQREKGKWLWVYDGGDALKVPMKAPTPPGRSPRIVREQGARRARHSAASADAQAGPHHARRQWPGQSADRTLGWDWKVEKTGARHLRVFQWTGARYAQVLYNDVPGQ